MPLGPVVTWASPFLGSQAGIRHGWAVTSCCGHLNGLHNTQFFTDVLVNCINGDNPSDPPNWKIKPFTQASVSSSTGSSKIHKIPRTQNHMADSLATRRLNSSQSIPVPLSTICYNPAHFHGCPLLCALQFRNP
jgi:hypothetical protein